MALTFNGSTGYLTFTTAIRTAFPMTIVAFVAADEDDMWNGNTHTVACVSDNAAANYNGIRMRNGNKEAVTQTAAWGGSGANKTSAPEVSPTSFQVMIGSWSNSDNVNVYFGSSTGTNDNVASQVDAASTYDRTVIGALASAGTFSAYFMGDLAEVHFYSTALTGTDYTSIVGGTDPEDITGWVDGWTLFDVDTLTSIGGTRTMTLSGGVTTSGLTHPVSGRTTGGGGSSPVALFMQHYN